ncbi:hypothetical protein QMK17_13040 [Rhodococcus sp. G-MC3]|nr:hypothetical protein [Rhodococcus sp. G-MC3]MDJ0394252.1 hypothetical protein [Rhodococcus sp. G-MC3]
MSTEILVSVDIWVSTDRRCFTGHLGVHRNRSQNEPVDIGGAVSPTAVPLRDALDEPAFDAVRERPSNSLFRDVSVTAAKLFGDALDTGSSV